MRLALLLLIPTMLDAQPRARFDVERLTDGVYATVRREPASLFFEPNSVFIVGPRDVLVVDAQFSIETTREVIAALRRLTDKPVRWVVNTHGHDDHVTGNQAYRDAYPSVQFIAHRATRDTMVGAGAQKRAEFLESLPGTIGYFRKLLSDGKSPDGSPISAEERAGFASDSMLGTRFLAESAQVRLIPADLVIDDRLELRQGERVIEIQHLGGGHSAGDLVVWLPAERIVAAGDLVGLPVPLVGSTSHPAAFADALVRLRGLGAATTVPGHGPVQRDDRRAVALEEMLRAIVSAVEAGVARGDSLAAVRRSIDLTRWRDRFAGESKLQRFAFENYVSDPAVAAAFDDASRSSTEREVLTVVQRLFDPEATLIGVRPGRAGDAPVVPRLSAADCAAFVVRDTRVDAAQLLRTKQGSRIMSIADTFVREGCTPRPPP